MFYRRLKTMFQRLTRTLRGRVSLWYLCSVAVIIIVFLVVMGSLFWLTLQNQIDHHIHIAVNEASEIVQNYRGREREDLLKNLVSAQGMTVIVLSADGSPILETNSPDVAAVTEHQLQKILASSNFFATEPLHFTESHIRFAAMPVQTSAGKGVLAVGYSTQILFATFARMMLIVVGIVAFLVVPITGLTYLVLKRQLLPLEQIAEQTKQVSDSKALAKRIRLSADTEEISIIQAAFNNMLSRLEAWFSREQQFFSDATHTLKTPLAVLKSQIENNPLSRRQQNELLATITAANDTVQDLLLLATVGSTLQTVQRISLSKLVQDLAELAHTLGEEKKLRVSTDISPGITIRADKKLLQRALGNLVQNAVTYNRPQGKINITLQRGQKKLRITITDTGIGISKKEQSKIFSRFFRGSKNSVAGSGLGLAISKAVIEDLGGQIRLQSQPKRGSSFTVILPN